MPDCAARHLKDASPERDPNCHFSSFACDLPAGAGAVVCKKELRLELRGHCVGPTVRSALAEKDSQTTAAGLVYGGTEENRRDANEG